jgi:ABC-type uncharacterized transport system fused permease/ATPase subunit
MLKKQQKKFPCPGWLPLPEALAPQWALTMALVLPFVSTFISACIARRLVPLDYAAQRLQASYRKAMVLAEEGPRQRFDGPGSHEKHVADATEPILIKIFNNSLQRWKINIGYGIWEEFYGAGPTILMFFGGTIRLFQNNSHNASKVTLGDLKLMQSAFSKVFGSLSVLVHAMPKIQSCRATLMRLNEFEAMAFDRGQGIHSVSKPVESISLLF